MATMNDMDGIKTAFKDNVVVVTAAVDLILKLIMCNVHGMHMQAHISELFATKLLGHCHLIPLKHKLPNKTK